MASILTAVELIFIRHGLPERVENADGTAANPSLQGLGHDQAEAVARWLADEGIHAVYVSPMARARETAAPLEAITGHTAAVREGIAEFDADQAAYIPMDELKKTDYPRWQQMMAGGYTLEDPADFLGLVVRTVDAIVDDHSGQNVAVVCHGGVINAYLAHVLGRTSEDFMFCNVDYTSVSRVMASSRGHRSLKSINETAHLRPLPDPEHR